MLIRLKEVSRDKLPNTITLFRQRLEKTICTDLLRSPHRCNLEERVLSRATKNLLGVGDSHAEHV